MICIIFYFHTVYLSYESFILFYIFLKYCIAGFSITVLFNGFLPSGQSEPGNIQGPVTGQGKTNSTEALQNRSHKDDCRDQMPGLHSNNSSGTLPSKP